VTANKLYKI